MSTRYICLYRYYNIGERFLSMQNKIGEYKIKKEEKENETIKKENAVFFITFNGNLTLSWNADKV